MTDATPLVDRAYEGILDLIRDREISLEEQVSQRRLAQRLGISKLPVTMALDRLKRDGLVQSEPRRGTRLVGIDAAGVWDLIQWRTALEVQTSRLASHWINPQQRELLMAAARQADLHNSPTHAPGNPYPDVHFHLLVGDCSACEQLRSELDRLDIYHLKVMMSDAVSAARRQPPKAPPNHVEVAQAILAGRASRAGELMRAHLNRSSVVYGFVTWYRRTRLSQKGA